MNYKCPICGCETHSKIDTNVTPEIYKGLDIDYSLFNYITSYVCDECGHVDWFMEKESRTSSRSITIKEVSEALKKQITDELESKKKELESLEDELSKCRNDLMNKIKEPKRQGPVKPKYFSLRAQASRKIIKCRGEIEKLNNMLSMLDK